MADEYKRTEPQINAASFTVNPVNTSGQTKIQVFAVDVEIILEPTYRYSGEYISGEQ